MSEDGVTTLMSDGRALRVKLDVDQPLCKNLHSAPVKLVINTHKKM